MTHYTDMSVEPNFAYQVAEWISGGTYRDIVVLEFHRAVNPTGILNCQEGYEAFVDLSQDLYNGILGLVDNYPAVIGVAVKLAGEWLVCHDCGSNYYTGHGPQGILALRGACIARKALLISREEEMENWLKERFELPRVSKRVKAQMNESTQFEKLVRSIQSVCAELPRRRMSLTGLNEENVRDHMLSVINPVFSGRGNGEAKNGLGKTDILVRTKDGLNEHIFELKVWSGMESVNRAIAQLSGYLTWNNKHAGILVLVKAKGFSSIIKKVRAGLEQHSSVRLVEEYGETAFRFKLVYPTDSEKLITIHLDLIPLS